MMLTDRRAAADLGQETIDILRSGRYVLPSGASIDIRAAVEACVQRTIEYPPGRDPRSHASAGFHTRISVENGTVLSVGRRLSHSGPVGALNFASATDPGGGFAIGAVAQEESIARSSALYFALRDCSMYGYHRAQRDAMYSDFVIFSPDVPVFRTDDGDLLEAPWLMSVITSPAVHAHGIRRYAPEREGEIADVMRVRAAKVLAVAAAHGVRRLILGAWGCGAFGGDPDVMAQIFRDALAGPFHGVFEVVVFAITDWSVERRFIGPFERAFAVQIDRADRYAGSLVGLAVGDALGTTLEFTARGSVVPIDDLVGGGPFNLSPGAWTDDTSMAMCLAESLVAQDGFDPRDQMQRYVRWWREGYWSSNGRCFDIGRTVSTALGEFERTGKAFAGSTDPQSAGNGSLMRVAPVALRYAHDPLAAIAFAGESSRTTHGAAEAVDACRYFAALIVGAVRGASKEALLADHYAPPGVNWREYPLAPAIAAIAGGSFKRKHACEVRATGYVVQTLEAALWAFHATDNFRDGALRAVNLGEDADTVGAVYGQLAGAYYGVDAIPDAWRTRIVRAGEIDALARALLPRM